MTIDKESPLYSMMMRERVMDKAQDAVADGAEPVALGKEQVEWVVNDIAELGVKIGNQFFWLYKGYSLVYGDQEDECKDGIVLHDNGEPMHWRPVGKREFGECCHPVNYEDLRKCRHPHYIGTVNLSDSDEWKQLPAQPLYTHHAPIPAAAAGKVLVPAEPTEAMLNAAKDIYNGGPYNVRIGKSKALEIYRAMLAAAKEGE